MQFGNLIEVNCCVGPRKRDQIDDTKASKICIMEYNRNLPVYYLLHLKFYCEITVHM